MSNTLKIRIYYEDTDAGGVVYYANYLKYFERGRTELLRNINVSQQKLFSDNIAFVVKNICIDYKAPAQLDDELLIKTTVAKCKKASIIFHQQITNKKLMIAEATVTVACVSLNNFLVTSIPNNLLIKIRENYVK